MISLKLELVYTLSEQGKEFMHVALPNELIPSFQLTRDLINRKVPNHLTQH